MTSNRERFFVVTGGPGSGKSTLIARLAEAGYARTIEAGRAIIQDQMAVDGSALPWRDKSAFAELMVSWEVRSYRWAEAQAGVVFFDRGVLDVIGYLRLSGLPVPKRATAAAQTCRYNRSVFIAPPWPEIFEQDRERRQTLDEAVRTYEMMALTYSAFGYDLIEIPRSAVEERARFIIERTAIPPQASSPD